MKDPNINASAAVAIIRCEQPVTSYLLLRRASHPEDPWSGHFSFPGGRKDPVDSDLFATCLRETAEETGIQLQPDQLIKTLKPEPAGQNFNHPLWVQPFVFSLSEQPELILDRSEIASSAWVSADEFGSSSFHGQTEMLPGRMFNTFPLQDYYLWGFTYRLLLKIVKPQG